MGPAQNESLAMPSLRRQAFLTGFVAAVLFFTGAYFFNYPVPGLFRHMKVNGSAILLLMASAGAGRRIWTFLRGSAGRWEAWLWSVALGLSFMIAGVFALGVVGLLRPEALALLTLAFVLAGTGPLRELREDFARLFQPMIADGRSRLLWVVGSLGLLTALICAWAPPTYYDSLVYHLALPEIYLREGRIGFVPYNHYSHFPQNAEMIFAWFLAGGTDLGAQVFNVFLSLLTAGALWGLGRRAFGPAPRWGLLLFATGPCVYLLSTETYVEASLAFFTTMSVWAALRGMEDGDRRAWVLAGIAGGVAAGIKYTGVLTPGLLTLSALFWPRPRTLRDRLRDGAAVGGTAFAVFLPWLVKNYVLTGGNPVFPFLPSIFPAKNVYMYAESSRAYFQVLSEYAGTSSLLVELFRMPFRLATDVSSFGGGFDVTGDIGWALPLILLPASLFLRPATRGQALLAVYTAAHVVLWASMRPVLRFLFPVFPLTCLLAGEALRRFRAESSRFVARAAVVWAALFLMSNGVLFYIVQSVRDPGLVAVGDLSREDYLRKKLDYYPAVAFMNERLPTNARVLFVGDQRGYYMRRSYLAPMALLPQPLRLWADEASDGEDLARRLRSLGFTHLFFNRREAKRIESYRVLDLTERGRSAFQSLLARRSALYDDGGAAVYSLESP
jgi:hypothetical protein